MAASSAPPGQRGKTMRAQGKARPILLTTTNGCPAAAGSGAAPGPAAFSPNPGPRNTCQYTTNPSFVEPARAQALNCGSVRYFPIFHRNETESLQSHKRYFR